MSAVPTQRPAADPNLDATEKAKLDYQLVLDKARMDIQYKKKVCELMWDKIVFGIIVALLGGVGVWLINFDADRRRSADAKDADKRRSADVEDADKRRSADAKELETYRQEEARKLEKFRLEEARNLEKFKLEEAKQRFFLEKKMDAMLSMETAMSGVTGVFFAYTKEKKDTPEVDARQEYQKALANAREVINRHEFLFGEEVNENLDRYFEIHKAIMKVGVTECADYRDFMSDLSNQFDRLCQSALHGDSISQMTLAKIPFEERDRLSPKEYLDKHFSFWKSKKTEQAN
jgi:hypothetical protein